ncbi:MAG: CHAT domain-containing protein, partial [Bacteroidota bacterium]
INRQPAEARKSLRYATAGATISLGNYSEAATLIEALVNEADGNPGASADAVSLRGFLNMNTGRNDLALEDLTSGLSLYATSGRAESRQAATCHSYLGTLYYNTGKYRQAEDQFLRSLEIRTRQFGNNHPEVGAALNDLGLVYGQTSPFKALDQYDKVLALYAATYGPQHPKNAIVHSNIGIMYKKLGLNEEAIAEFEKASAIWKTVYPKGHPNQALVLSYLGQTHALLDHHEQAASYFRQALKQYRSAYGERHPDIAATCNQVAQFHSGDGRYDSALFYLRAAMVANSRHYSGKNPDANPSASDHFNPYVLLYTLQQKAGVLEQRHYAKSLRAGDLRQAVAALDVCDTLISLIRRQSAEESDKITLGSIANEVFEDGVRTCQAVSEMELRPRPWLEHAMRFAEKSKAAVLLEAIADASAKSYAGLPDSLLERERNLRADLSLLNRRLAEAAGSAGEAGVRSALFALKAEQELFTARLRRDYPRYFNLKYQGEIPGVDELQRLIGPEAAVVSYFIAEKNSSVYLFIVTKKGFDVKVRKMPAELNRIIKGYYNSLLYNQPAIYRTTAPVLANLLDPRLGGSIRRLHIIPSGPLGTLPFEALPAGKKVTGDSFASAYWIDRYSIGYEFSTALLAGNVSAGGSVSTRALLCAPVSFDADRGLNDLPGTREEVNTIASIFKDSGDLLLDGDATEQQLRNRDLSQYRYLHLATHGIAEETAPELSRIYLRRSEGDDGDLFSGEIYNLTLQADVVTLSACQTGLGKVSKGEGVIGLSRALRYAGARHVIVSYWSVSDQSTSSLMIDFYNHFKGQGTPDYQEAMAEAKRRMIRSEKFRNPFYWAPFVILGF